MKVLYISKLFLYFFILSIFGGCGALTPTPTIHGSLEGGVGQNGLGGKGGFERQGLSDRNQNSVTDHAIKLEQEKVAHERCKNKSNYQGCKIKEIELKKQFLEARS